MKAVFLAGQAPGGKRTPLEGELPLSTPYVVQFFPIYACNFACRYCHFSIEKSKRCFVTDRVSMDMDLFQKCVGDMTAFPEKIRTLRFVGMGEPLLHRDIGRMVAYAKERGVASRVELLTNGSLLTNETADRLIAAGLDRLVVSLQGTGAEKYREVSGIDLDFPRFVDQLRYCYEHRKNTHMYLKIVDIALNGEDDRKRYLEIFGDICDSIGVETAVPIYPGVDCNTELSRQDARTQFGTTIVRSKICPQPFFTLQINPDGKVVGCYSVTYPEFLGEADRENIVDIWCGEKYNNFRRRMLAGRETVCDVCRSCGISLYRQQPEDIILNTDGSLCDAYAGTVRRTRQGGGIGYG
ncbi:MAG: radical SAM protein [Planctomycetota bacterium]|jgi:MoaA/NifB/PqqE/SkfB family radical SAM enzyme|nr:radical SAM protein [Planctomycetota bacterium]